MSLCSCHEWERDYGSWAWFPPDPKDFTRFSEKRRRRCENCNELVNIGAPCLEFPRLRAPRDEIEERIKGEEIPYHELLLCEKCGEIWLNLDALGYCVEPWDLEDQLAEYHEETGWEPGKGPGPATREGEASLEKGNQYRD